MTALPTPGPAPPQEAPANEPSWLAQERAGPGRPGVALIVVEAVLAAAVVSVLLAVPHQEVSAAEATLKEGSHWWGVMLRAFGIEAMRVFVALASALAVVAVGFAGRRLLQSDLAGGAASLLLALDPAFMAWGRLAVPEAVLVLAAVGALALVVSPHPIVHWLAWVPLSLGTVLDPWFLLWGVALWGLLFFRGHIYGAPKHLVAGFAQALALPGAVAGMLHGLLAVVRDGTGASVCPPIGRWGALTLQDVASYGDGLAAVPGPATWLAGALALLLLGGAAAYRLADAFRFTRQPGRIQFRLEAPLARMHGRSLWLVWLAVLAPAPFLWLPLFALGLAHGSRQLARDAPAFGIAVYLALVAFASVYLVRLAPLAFGGDVDAAAVLEASVPWANLVTCT